MATRICKQCHEEKPVDAFELLPRGYRRRTCRVCLGRTKRNRPAAKAWKAKNQRSFRKNNPHRAITTDCRSSDKKTGLLGNDITPEFVATEIEKGCCYCGTKAIRMTLDRVDNTKAHTTANVVPCCIRCNYIRGSMPFAAWTLLVPAIRQAVEQGLFGTWRTKPLRN